MGRRRLNRTPESEIAAGIKAIEAAGATVEHLDPCARHYRIAGPHGGTIDFWPTTGRWLVTRTKRDGGLGLETLLKRLAEIAPPAPPAPIDVTVFADAPICSKTGAAGWGGWFKAASMERGQTCGGQLSARLKTSGEAEAQAIANTLAVVEGFGLLSTGATVMLQSDSLETLSAIRGRLNAEDRPAAKGCSVSRRRRTVKSKPMAAALDFIGEVTKRHSLRLIVRHVRGHQSGDGRNWVNRECDRLAKAGMRARRDDLQQGASA